MQRVDLVIQDGILCTMNSVRDVKESSAVVINDGKIIDIVDSQMVKNKYIAETTLDGSSSIIMPGLVNTHTHSALTFLRGISDDLSLMDWLTNYIWPLERKFIDEPFVYWATRLAIYEMVMSGTTTFNDSYFFSREVVKAAKQMGVRCVAGELVFDAASPIGKTSSETLSYSEENFQEWKNDELISISVAPHSLYACSRKVIKAAYDLANKHNGLTNILISESQNEVTEIIKKHGATPVEVLHDLGVLNSNLIATHCVHLTPRDIELLSKSSVGISHNPESNMKLGNGVAPILDLLKSGALVGLGTDGAASNNDLSLLSEIDFATKLQKGTARDSTVFNSLKAVEMLTIDGARVLKLDQKIGSIEIGKQADIIFLNLRSPNLTPIYNPYSHIVYASNSSDVHTVIINGKIIVKDRVMVGQDIDEILDEANRYSSEIKEHLGL